MNILKQWFDKTWQRWLKQRFPGQQTVTLDRSNIFIFPTWFGCCYVLLCLLLFLLGTNYQNNLIVLLSMLLISVFLTTLLKCYQNLAGIELTGLERGEHFAQQPLTVYCQLRAKKLRHGFVFNYKNQSQTLLDNISNENKVRVDIGPKSRGNHDLGRLTIASIYPLGLFRAWSHVDLSHQVVVFPNPLPHQAEFVAIEQARRKDHSSATNLPAGDDFAGLNAFRPGESLKHVAWKRVAQGRGMYTKHFEQQVSEPQWLDLDQIAGNSLEQKLSFLCHMVIDFSHLNYEFGLNLAGKKLAVSSGNNHRLQALTMLANHGGGHD